jgi:hypothetical protein
LLNRFGIAAFAHAEHGNLLVDPTFPARREWRLSMKHLICAFAACGSLASPSVSAADLGGYEERETYIERPARVIERERIVERHYYEPRYYYEPEVYYAPRPRVYGYYAAEYPYYYGPRFVYRHHWRSHYGRW